MIVVIIPTFNAGAAFQSLLDSLHCQLLRTKLLVLDSESDDATISFASRAGGEAHIVPRNTFNHGATRQKGVDLCPDAEIIIFMTQDAVLASADSLKNLISCFDDKKVGAAYGRQLPHHDATPIASHARLFNYPSGSQTKSKKDIPRLGIKTAFISNSFAAYRREALMEVGGFPSDVIFGEDTYVAAKMLLAGWNLAYAADATCYHSHNYKIMEEFERYFDIGVFLSREKWFVESLGKAEGEGMRFIFSELRYLIKTSPWLVPSAITRTVYKLLGYKLGQREQMMLLGLKRTLSMNKRYWDKSGYRKCS